MYNLVTYIGGKKVTSDVIHDNLIIKDHEGNFLGKWGNSYFPIKIAKKHGKCFLIISNNYFFINSFKK